MFPRLLIDRQNAVTTAALGQIFGFPVVPPPSALPSPLPSAQVMPNFCLKCYDLSYSNLTQSKINVLQSCVYLIIIRISNS